MLAKIATSWVRKSKVLASKKKKKKMPTTITRLTKKAFLRMSPATIFVATKDNESVDATEDPVRMYLMQMGEIPLLTRQEEVSAAKRIELTRTDYRQWMLASDFMLQGATKLLEQVRDSKLRLDRTIEVSVTNASEKIAIMRRIGPNVKTLRHLLLAKSWRLLRCDQQELAYERTTPSLEAIGSPPQQGRPIDRRNEFANQSFGTDF